jgi:uncharacterized protein
MQAVIDLPLEPTTVFEEPLKRLHPNARINALLANAITFTILTLVGCVAEILFTASAWPWPRFLPLISLVGGSLLTCYALLIAYLQYARFGYQLREKDLIVESGVIWRSRRCVPRSRIQHVDIDSGPIDRALGLVEVRLYVAGGMGAVAELPGVAPEAAEQLKEALIVAPTDGV